MNIKKKSKEQDETAKNELAILRGKRLRDVIDKHFESQASLARILGLSINTINDNVTGRRLLSEKVAKKFERIAGINSEYLLFGIGNMLTSKSPYTIEQFILSRHGNRQTVTKGNEVDLYRFLTDGLKNPSLLMLVEEDFCSKYNLKISSYIIFDRNNFVDGDIVIAIIGGRKHILAGYTDKALFDIADKIKYNVDEVNIMGAVIYTIQ